MAVSIEGPALRVVAASNAPAATNEARLENDGSYMSGKKIGQPADNAGFLPCKAGASQT